MAEAELLHAAKSNWGGGVARTVRLWAIARPLWRLAVDTALAATAFLTVTVLPAFQTDLLSVRANVVSVLEELALYCVIAAIALAAMRTYRTIWRYVSFRDLLSLFGAASLTVLAFAVVELALARFSLPVPVSTFVTAVGFLWIVMVGYLAAPRMISRSLFEWRGLHRRSGESSYTHATAALIVGDVGRMEAFMRESGRNSTPRHRIVGVLTDDPSLHGSFLHGVEVFGDVDQLASAMIQLSERGVRPQTLILARDDASRRDFERLLEIAGPAGLKVGRLPPLGSLHDTSRVHPVELSDLLGRPEVRADIAPVAAMVQGKTIFVTGGGGSIGGELSRQIAGLKPAKLVVADACEFNLYSIEMELAERFPHIEREAALLDVRDGDLVHRWIERIRPDVVFHAAALKHVPLLEDHPIEAVKTNVLGTVNVAEACHKCGVRTLVTVSTDKAVNPSNVMGATKRLAEAYCQGLDQAGEISRTTRIITVRFGNVLGSAGSVVPLFQRQIEAGGPVTVTHPDITRFFMTIPEAVALVLQAGAQGMSLNEDRGSIYVLEMGRAVKVLDLAKQLIRLSGQRPDEDIKIQIIGLRPGEKLYEEVMHHDESVIPTRNQSVMRLAPRVTDLRIIRQQIQELKQAAVNADSDRILRLLKVSVPEYTAAAHVLAALS